MRDAEALLARAVEMLKFVQYGGTAGYMSECRFCNGFGTGPTGGKPYPCKKGCRLVEFLKEVESLKEPRP